MKLSNKITELMFEDKFIEMSTDKQDEIINREIKELEFTYSKSLSNEYFFYLGIKINKPDNSFHLKIILKNKIKDEKGLLSLREKDNSNKYKYYDITSIERKENTTYYLSISQDFEINTDSSFDVISSASVNSIFNDLS